MKLPAFDYHAPGSLDEAIALLAASGGSARPLAGGQSFLPIMAFRLANPSALVDLRRIPDLDRIEVGAQEVRLGAMVRWSAIERSAELAHAMPVLGAAIEHVAHYQIRNRGTVGGSLAHADPAAEFPAVAVACDAMIDIALAAPRSLEALGALRSATRGIERSPMGEHLVAAVERAYARDPATLPKLERPNRNGGGAAVELLKVLLRQASEESGVAAKMIATVDDLEALASSDRADVPALQGWRRKVFGARALELKKGNIALTVENGRVAVLEWKDGEKPV